MQAIGGPQVAGYAVALFPEPEVRSGRPRRILEEWIDRFAQAALEIDAPLELT
jgi:hypothetical protein